jgi:acetyl-CoA acyltransferase
VTTSTRTVSNWTKARAPTPRWKAWPSCAPVFAAKGSVTAGNSSADQRRRRRADPGQRKGGQAVRPDPAGAFVSASPSRGVPPEIMGIGPIEAIPAALRYAGLKQDDIGWFELNEAFAAQSLAVINTLGLDPAKVNPMGGAIALGHPLGATGAIRAATVVHALRRHNLKYGMVTMCVGTGQGAAGIFERV